MKRVIIDTHTNTNTHAHTHTYTHTLTQIHTHTHIHTHIHTHLIRNLKCIIHEACDNRYTHKHKFHGKEK